jgi:RNA-binding protein YlmH
MNLISKSEIDEIESDAIRAAENWDVSVTPFYSPENAKLISDRLSSRADLGFIQVGGLPSSLRTRFVMSNPDLELDPISAQAEYCVLLCVDHVDTAPLRKQSPWPHVFTQIGVDLENVGDVVVEDNNAYIVVVPKVAKQCCRLIPKELRGVGLTVSVVQPGEYFPFDGMQQDMYLGKLDKRALKYK